MSNKTERKQKIGIIARLSVIVTSIFAMIAMSVSSAFAVVTFENPETTIQKGAEAMLIANAFKKCMSHIHSNMSGSSFSDDIYEGDWTDIGVGIWLETLTQGKVQNGSIYCNQGENLPDLLAQRLGISRNQILCNDVTPGKPGILKAADYVTTYTGGRSYTTSYVGRDTDCGTSAAKYYIKNPEAGNYMKEIWNKYKDPVWPSWDSVGDYTDASKTGMYAYFMYRKEYDVFCADNSKIGTTTSSTYDESKLGSFSHLTGLKDVDGTTGAIKYQWYTNSKSGTVTYGYVEGENGKSCDGLIKKANDFSGYYQDYVKGLIKTGCKNGLEANREKWQAIVDDPEASEAAKEAAKTNIASLDEAKKNDYVVATEDGDGLQCATVKEAEAVAPGAVVDIDGTVSGTDKPTCMNTGAMQSLGWIVCPVLDILDNASRSLYSDFVEPALQVEPKLFTGAGGSTKEGWDLFRNIANVVVIILFLAVIFSQLTGYGIDNYGIKKTLPKIIVAAILMNLSYWICVAMVDVSNIIGNSIQSFFNGLAGKVTMTAVTWDVGNALGSAGATVLTAVAILGALAIAVFAALAEGGIVGLVLALLIGALVVVISIFFLFIILAAREAAIVILVVLSPLAVACFMLPNTKRMFDKWWKFFYSLLMVYPICGLLVGGGNYVSKLILAAGAGDAGFFSAFTAMIIGVVPIFFIPGVLRKSLNMVGDIGSKISGMGSRMGGRLKDNTNRAVKGSERYKNYQDDRLRQRKLNAADRNIRRLSGRSDLTDRQRRLLAQSMNTVASERETDALRNNLINGGFDARMAGADAKADAQRVSDIEAMLTNGRMNMHGAQVNAGAADAINANDMAKNDATSLRAFHAAALQRYVAAAAAGDIAARDNASAQIRAVQNLMSKTDAGRGAVMSNLSAAALTNTNEGAVRQAASHLMSAFGDTYKTKDRGAHKMIQDLSTGEELANIQAKVHDGTYDAYGVDKYTEETLAGADEAALDNLIAAMSPLLDADGNMLRGASLTGDSLRTLQNTAYQALEKAKTGMLNIKPEIAAKLERIRGDYVSSSAATAQAVEEAAQRLAEQNAQNLQEINDMLHQHNNGGSDGGPTPPVILGPDGKPLSS